MQAAVSSDPVLSAEEVRLLVDVGYLAAGFGHPEAHRIFNGLHTVRPDLSAPLIGLAMYYMEGGKAAEAVTILQQGIAGGLEKRIELQAFLGMALIAAKRNQEAGRILRRVIAESEELNELAAPPELRMAHRLLKHYVLPLAQYGGDAMHAEPGISSKLE